MHPEAFEHHEAVHDYAERHGLAYLWKALPHSRTGDARLRPSSIRSSPVRTPKRMPAPRHAAIDAPGRRHIFPPAVSGLLGLA